MPATARAVGIGPLPRGRSAARSRRSIAAKRRSAGNSHWRQALRLGFRDHVGAWIDQQLRAQCWAAGVASADRRDGRQGACAAAARQFGLRCAFLDGADRGVDAAGCFRPDARIDLFTRCVVNMITGAILDWTEHRIDARQWGSGVRYGIALLTLPIAEPHACPLLETIIGPPPELDRRRSQPGQSREPGSWSLPSGVVSRVRVAFLA